MALVPCPSCGNQISQRAIACPVCGYRLSQPSYQPSRPVPYQGPSSENDGGSRPIHIKDHNKPKGVPGWLIALMVLMLVAIIGLVAYIVLHNKSVQSQQSGSYGVDSVKVEVSSDAGYVSGEAEEEAPEPEAMNVREEARLGTPVGRDEWQEYWIDATKSKYVNVRSYTDASVDDNIVARLYSGDHFFGNRIPENPDWIEVFDVDGNHIGYVKYKCARHTGNHS